MKNQKALLERQAQVSHGTNIQLSTRLERKETMYIPKIAAGKAFLCMLTLVAAIATAWPRTGFGQDPSPNGATRLNCDEPPCDAVARGRAAFHDRNLNQLGGNGRACSDCHLPSDGFQLSPAAAQARFAALQARLAHNQNADDPLFRPVDADDFRVNGESASDYSNLLENGLIRVTMPLPGNVRLIDPMTGLPTAETTVDLWRAVMPVFNVAITGPDSVTPIWPPGAPRVPIFGIDANGPNRQGGYQHDARFGTLQEQARGALLAHAQVVVEPPARMLDDLAAVQRTLFSSPGVELLSQAIHTGSATFPDPDPELNELEQQGKVIFNRACAQCHGGTLHPSGSTPDATLPGIRTIVRYHNILAACPRPAVDGFAPCPPRLARTARTYRITLADGSFQSVTTSDPGRLLLTGQPADVGIMDVTQLRGISRTAPYFHNNSAATLEEVLDHYDALFRRVARLNPPPNLPPIISSNGLVVDRGFVGPEERAALLAYLRKL
jgi:cytochrome c peroxidase